MYLCWLKLYCFPEMVILLFWVGLILVPNTVVCGKCGLFEHTCKPTILAEASCICESSLNQSSMSINTDQSKISSILTFHDLDGMRADYSC
jgi:hypothetical protein